MTEQTTPDATPADETTRKSYTVIVATGLTVLWAIVAGWIFSNAAMCVSPGTGNFIADRFLCLPANAIGDMLAGAFAPLAFLWLTAAVILQRNELAAQRQELRESREVARQQVQEARNNVLLIQKQTQLLEEEGHRRTERACDEDIGELVKILATMFASRLDGFAIGTGSDKNGNFSEKAQIVAIIPSDIADEYLRCQHYVDQILTISSRLHMWVESATSVFYNDLPFRSVLRTMEQIDSLADDASAPMVAKLRLYGLLGCYTLTLRLEDNLEKFARPLYDAPF